MIEEEFFQNWQNPKNLGVFALIAKSKEERLYFRRHLKELRCQAQVDSCEGSGAEALLRELNAPSLFVKQRCLIVEEAQASSPRVPGILQNMAQDRSEWAVALLFPEPVTTKAWRAVLQNAWTLDLSREKPWDTTERWHQSFARIAISLTCTISSSASGALARRCRGYRQLANQELIRLATFVGPKGTIDEALVKEQIPALPQELVWPLLANLERLDLPNAWQSVRDLSVQGGSAPLFIAVLRSHFQNMRVGLEAQSAGNFPPGSWQQKKHLQRLHAAKQLGNVKLDKMIGSLHQVESELKLGDLTPDEMLTRWFELIASFFWKSPFGGDRSTCPR